MHTNRLQYQIVLPIIAFHLALLAAPFTFQWDAIGVALGLWWVSGLGVSIGFHRLLTHGAFRTHPFVRYLLTILGCLANEGPPLVWVGTHRIHHRFADHEGDPHSPGKSMWWGHVAWAAYFDHDSARIEAKDLEKDAGLKLIDRFFWLPNLLLTVFLYALGGWSWVVWGIVVRTVFFLHCTWFVSSVAHSWGYRTFEVRDTSTNSWWVALLTFGDGWHNNHHAQPRSAAHGIQWWELDVSYLVIRAMEGLGIAWDLQRPIIASPRPTDKNRVAAQEIAHADPSK